jgi:hypothetical protein
MTATKCTEEQACWLGRFPAGLAASGPADHHERKQFLAPGHPCQGISSARLLVRCEEGAFGANE